jgi:hypothetical protein
MFPRKHRSDYTEYQKCTCQFQFVSRDPYVCMSSNSHASREEFETKVMFYAIFDVTLIDLILMTIMTFRRSINYSS